MNTDAVFDKLLNAYGGYYNIEREGCKSPFDAVGFLSNEAEQYFLVKAAKIAFVRSYEYAYFKKCALLDKAELDRLDSCAWEDGVSKARPSTDHKNTDVALLIVADALDADVKDAIGSYKHSRNYKLGLHGFSNYRLIVIESGTDTVYTNRRGRDLTDFVTKVIH